MVLYGVPTTLYAPLPSLFPMRNGTSTEYVVHDYLSETCVETTLGQWLVRDHLTKEWNFMSKQSAVINVLTADHSGIQVYHGNTISVSRENITDYIKKYCPVVQGWTFIPNGDRFVTFDGKRCINRFNEATIKPADAAHLCTGDMIDQEVTGFLHMIRSSLCNFPYEPSMTLEQMIEEINSPTRDKLEFQFVMQWLAAIFQRPGINVETNIWFIGDMKGVGKGTLTRVLRLIWGNLVGRAPVNDFEKGWTDDIEGHIFMEVDEFDANTKTDWNKLIKRDTTNQIISLNKRHFGGYKIINITNWIFHSNNENPLPPEQDDRRNMQILTTNDPQWKKFAWEFNQRLNADPLMAEQIAQAFAGVLTLIDVDMKFISLAPDTEVRRDNKAHALNAVERWLREDERYPRDEWLDGRELFTVYFEVWRDRYHKNSTIKSSQSWGQWINKLVRRDAISKRESDHSNHVEYLIPSATFEAGTPTPKAAKVVFLQDRLKHTNN